MKLNVKALALTAGILWGLSVFIITWWIIIFDGASTDPIFVSKIYRCYQITPLGSVIGLIWGFFDGLIGGAIFGLVYNCFAGRGKKSEPAA
ncbi:MAG: bacteriophage holin [bacterium]